MECELRANLHRFRRLERRAADQRHDVDAASQCNHELYIELYRRRWIGCSIGRGCRHPPRTLDHPRSLADNDRQHGLLHPDLEYEQRDGLYRQRRLERAGGDQRLLADG
jgi:hypothetical protein